MHTHRFAGRGAARCAPRSHARPPGGAARRARSRAGPVPRAETSGRRRREFTAQRCTPRGSPVGALLAAPLGAAHALPPMPPDGQHHGQARFAAPKLPGAGGRVHRTRKHGHMFVGRGAARCAPRSHARPPGGAARRATSRAGPVRRAETSGRRRVEFTAQGSTAACLSVGALLAAPLGATHALPAALPDGQHHGQARFPAPKLPGAGGASSPHNAARREVRR